MGEDMVDRRKLWIGVVAAGLLLAGCADEPYKTTSADSTLAEVLVELHLLAARKAVVGDEASALRDSVWARYGMDSAMVARRLEAYARNPKALQRLHQIVQDRLLAEQYASPLPQLAPRR